MDKLASGYEQTYLVSEEVTGLTAYKAAWKEYQETFRAYAQQALAMWPVRRGCTSRRRRRSMQRSTMRWRS